MADELDLSHVRVVAELEHANALISCRIDPQGRYVFAGSEDNTVQRWSLADGSKVAVTGHESWVRSIVFSNDGETTITGGYDGRLIWWKTGAVSPSPAHRIDAHQGWIRSMCVSPDGELLATGGNDLTVRLWKVADGACIREIVGHERHVYSVCFHPSGEFVLTGDLTGAIKQWCVKTGELLRTFDAASLHTYGIAQQVDYGGVRTIAVSPDGNYLTAGGLHKATNPQGAINEPLQLLWEWDSQKQIRSHVADGISSGALWRTVFLNNSTLMGACGGTSGGFLLFWKPDSDKAFHRFTLPTLLRDMDLHPDGVRVATAHYDRRVRLVSLAAA